MPKSEPTIAEYLKEIAKRGGSSRSAAKVEAAKANMALINARKKQAQELRKVS